MKKLLFSLIGILCSMSLWAAVGDKGSESFIYGTSTTSGTTYNGTSFSIDGAYILGNGSTKSGNMAGKGQKVQCVASGSDYIFVISVSAGYKITGIELHANINGNGKTGTMSDIKFDGSTPAGFTSSAIPARDSNPSASLDLNITKEASDNITMYFTSMGSRQMNMELTVNYEETESITYELTDFSINGTSITSSQLDYLKTNKTITLNDLTLNGVGVGVATTSPASAVSVTRTITAGTKVAYTFAVGANNYTVNVPIGSASYTKQGNVLAYKEGSTMSKDKDGNETDATKNTLVLNGLIMEYPTKSIQYGVSSVNLGGAECQPIKLSTGEAFTVSFPAGKVATKLVVYGWSAANNGKLSILKETQSGAKSIDVNSDIFYAGNTSSDVYPSVYEYDLDGWKSLYMSAGGSASQPFIVLDVVLEDSKDITINTTGISSCVTNIPLDFTDVDGVTCYVVENNSALNTTEGTLTVTPVKKVNAGAYFIKGTPGNHNVPVLTGDAEDYTNIIAGSTSSTFTATNTTYALSANDGMLHPVTEGTVIPANIAYLNLATSARSLRIVYGNTTGIKAVNAEKVANAKFIENGRIVIVKDGAKYNVAGQVIK